MARFPRIVPESQFIGATPPSAAICSRESLPSSGNSATNPLADDSGGSPVTPHLEDFSYLGQGTIVQRAHGQPGVNLSYLQQSRDSSYNNDGGDQ